MRFYYMLSFWLVYVASQSLLRLALAATGGGTLASSAGATLGALAADAFAFRRMYATGTRTVRGLEAISLSVPPTPGQSILRRPDNDHLQTLGSILAGQGYACDFVYGGDGFFNNMNNFFSRNDYTIKDRATIPSNERSSAPETVWGVADEVLYTQVLRSLDEHAAAGEPAFEMVMTTSNHRPFTFPRGRDAAADAAAISWYQGASMLYHRTL